MIAPLRRRHRWMTGLLMVVVPLLYVVALSGRQAAPVMDEVPRVFTEGSDMAGEVVTNGLDFDGLPVTAQILRTEAGWKVGLEPSEPLARPEVLLYWTDQQGAEGGLPDDAYLLGAFGGTRAQSFAVPPATQGRAGRLVLYSLGHQEVVGSVVLPAIGAVPAAEAGETPAVPAAEAGETSAVPAEATEVSS